MTKEIESFLDKAIQLRHDANTLRCDIFETWCKNGKGDYGIKDKLIHAMDVLEDTFLDLQEIIEDMTK